MALPSNSLSPITRIDNTVKFVMADQYQGFGVVLPSTLVDFLKSQISFSWTTQSYVPTDGNTITTDKVASFWALIKPLSGLTTLSVILPLAQPGWRVRLSASQVIANITVSAQTGQFVNYSSISSLGLNGKSVDFEFNGLDNTWYIL